MRLQPWTVLLPLLILSLARPSGTYHRPQEWEAVTERHQNGLTVQTLTETFSEDLGSRAKAGFGSITETESVFGSKSESGSRTESISGSKSGSGSRTESRSSSEGQSFESGQCPSQCHVWLKTVLACQRAEGIPLVQLTRCVLSLPSLQVVDLESPAPFCNCTLLQFAERASDFDIVTFTRPPCPLQLMLKCGSRVPNGSSLVEQRGLVAGMLGQQQEQEWRRATKRHLSRMWSKVNALRPDPVKKEYSSRLRTLIKDVSRRKREDNKRSASRHGSKIRRRLRASEGEKEEPSETDIIITETDEGTEIDAVKHTNGDHGAKEGEEQHKHVHLDEDNKKEHEDKEHKESESKPSEKSPESKPAEKLLETKPTEKPPEPKPAEKAPEPKPAEKAPEPKPAEKAPESPKSEAEAEKKTEKAEEKEEKAAAPSGSLDWLLYVVGALLVVAMGFGIYTQLASTGACGGFGAAGGRDREHDDAHKPLLDTDAHEDIEHGAEHHPQQPDFQVVIEDDKPLHAPPPLISAQAGQDNYEKTDEHQDFLKRLTTQRLSIYQAPMEDYDDESIKSGATDATGATASSASTPAPSPAPSTATEASLKTGAVKTETSGPSSTSRPSSPSTASTASTASVASTASTPNTASKGSGESTPSMKSGASSSSAVSTPSHSESEASDAPAEAPVPRKRTLSLKKPFSKWEPEDYELIREGGVMRKPYSQWSPQDFDRARQLVLIDVPVPGTSGAGTGADGDERKTSTIIQPTVKPAGPPKPSPAVNPSPAAKPGPAAKPAQTPQTQKPPEEKKVAFEKGPATLQAPQPVLKKGSGQSLANLATASSIPLAAVAPPPPPPQEPSKKQLARRRMTIQTKFGEVGADFRDDKVKEHIPDHIKYGGPS